MNVLVTDAVPMNGGDELLLRALVQALSSRWPSSQITVMTHAVDVSRRLMPDLHFVGDLSVVPDEARRHYERADIVISTPGGFLNRHYGLDDRLRGFALATALGRRLVLFAQSIGPFGSDEEHRAVGKALRGASLVAVRDAVSRHHLALCGIEGPHVAQVPDAAFLWPHAGSGACEDAQRPVRRVGICLRRWPRRDATAFRETVRKTRRLMRYLAGRGVEEFMFASTCQGVDGYVDDSELSERVLVGLEPALACRTHVTTRRYHPPDYMALVGRCDLFIGMRLHACLMAILAGTPALGLAYEAKTPEIFGQLGLARFQVPFTSPASRWSQVAGSMVDDIAAVRSNLAARVANQSARATASLALLDAC